MKRIAVIAGEISFANAIKKNLELYFDGFAEIIAYSTGEIDGKETVDEEVVVLSSFTIFKKVSGKINEKTILQVINFTLCKENIMQLEQIPKGSRALLVNVDNRMCMQLITQIYEAGYRNLDLVPYFGEESQRDKTIRMAITSNEPELVPRDIEEIIDIGDRVIDTNCIVDLAEKLNIKGIFNSARAKKARNDVVEEASGINMLLSENESINESIRALMEYIEEGIIITDVSGEIHLSNEKANEMLKNNSEILEGFTIDDIIPGFGEKVKINREQIFPVDGKNLVISKKNIVSNGYVTGDIITIKNFEELEDRQHGIRTRLSGSNHSARFTFDDIIGESREIKNCIEIAKRISKSDSAVLIIGASGTGKEIFAQSIHNESKRSKYNFVALNCAAIPENLLESELFGYEEGAFTGAKKGGKIGYFELAHNGTIFLDEIGEMPMALQSKLLRVLEEKKISKVGSSKLIDIDVRVIAATNKNLFRQVENNQFREDLYYRLNVLPLDIPDINNRGNDILVLFNSFAGDLGAKWSYSNDFRRLLLNHKWRGNVREIRNIVEYLDSLGKQSIEASDLPGSFFLKARDEGRKEIQSWETLPRRKRNISFILREGNNIELHYLILKAMTDAKNENKKIGRSTIEQYFAMENIDYTVTEVRNAMKKLADSGFIKSQRGRSGSSITDLGTDLADDIKGLIGL